MILYGPPGTGKTRLAKVVAIECQLAFIGVKVEVSLKLAESLTESLIESLTESLIESLTESLIETWGLTTESLAEGVAGAGADRFVYHWRVGGGHQVSHY